MSTISIAALEPEPEPAPESKADEAPPAGPLRAAAMLTVHDGRPRAGSVKVFDALDLEPGDLSREVSRC